MCDERGESLAGPSGCLQYYTGTAGRVSSFGFPDTSTTTSIGDDGKDPNGAVRGDPNRAPDRGGGGVLAVELLRGVAAGNTEGLLMGVTEGVTGS